MDKRKRLGLIEEKIRWIKEKVRMDRRKRWDG